MSDVGHRLDPKLFALSNHSTTQALVYLLHLILTSLDHGYYSSGIFYMLTSKTVLTSLITNIIDESIKLQVNPAVSR